MQSRIAALLCAVLCVLGAACASTGTSRGERPDGPAWATLKVVSETPVRYATEFSITQYENGYELIEITGYTGGEIVVVIGVGRKHLVRKIRGGSRGTARKKGIQPLGVGGEVGQDAVVGLGGDGDGGDGHGLSVIALRGGVVGGGRAGDERESECEQCGGECHRSGVFHDVILLVE